MNRVLREFARKGGFRVVESELSPASQAMNRVIRGQPPAAAPEPEAEPEPWHSADAGEGRGQSLPRRAPSMDDLIRGHRRHAQSERAAEADAARLEREQSGEHRSW